MDESLPLVLVHPLGPAPGWLPRLRAGGARPSVAQLDRCFPGPRPGGAGDPDDDDGPGHGAAPGSVHGEPARGRAA
ncbi:hypothetical protein LV779_08440 [Streptomyces thinghirensis]|nr:hypothetical protein [Streptomyces thinghirensis]